MCYLNNGKCLLCIFEYRPTYFSAKAWSEIGGRLIIVADLSLCLAVIFSTAMPKKAEVNPYANQYSINSFMFPNLIRKQHMDRHRIQMKQS